MTKDKFEIMQDAMKDYIAEPDKRGCTSCEKITGIIRYIETYAVKEYKTVTEAEFKDILTRVID